LGVHMTNQYLAQLPQKIQDAVLSSVGTILSFEVGAEDAAVLSKEFEPMIVNDFMDLPRFNFYIKLMIDGKTSHAFSGVSLPPETTHSALAPQEIALSLNRLAYGIPKFLAEAEIKQRLGLK